MINNESLPKIVRDFLAQRRIVIPALSVMNGNKVPNLWNEEFNDIRNFYAKIDSDNRIPFLEGIIQLQRYCQTYSKQQSIELDAGFIDIDPHHENFDIKELKLQNDLLIKSSNNIIEWAESILDIEKKNEKIQEATNNPTIEKLNWLGTPEQFGFIFGELVAKGFIELPLTNGEGSISKYAKICSQFFNIRTKNKETTSNNLERVLNPKKNSLTTKVKFKIPFQRDI